MQSRLYIYFSALRMASCVVCSLESGRSRVVFYAKDPWKITKKIVGKFHKTTRRVKEFIIFSVIFLNFFACLRDKIICQGV